MGGVTIKQLVFDFFELLGLSPVEIHPGIWQVQADEALMKELDGWRAQARLLQFTWDRDLAAAYGAELISPGSYRLASILRLIRQQGILSRAHIPHHFFHEPSIRKKVLAAFGTEGRAYVLTSSARYGQYLQLEISVEARGLQKKESLHTVIVNLSSGQVLKFALPPHLLQAGGVEPELINKRKCSLKQAYLRAAEHLSREFAGEDQSWAQKAREKMALEEEKLQAFFQGKTSSPEFAAKQEELRRRLQPVLAINALRAALVYAPLFHYRLVVVSAGGRERTKTATYDPIANLCALD